MLGISYGQWFVILGISAAVIGPKDLPRIARQLGRMAGRSIAYVQMARGQMDSVMQQSQARQVHKELQETMAQLDVIRYEIRGLSMLNPGPMTKSLLEKTLDASPDGNAGTMVLETEKPEVKQSLQNVEPKFPEGSVKTSVATDTVSQAAAFARLAVASKANSDNKQHDDPGLLSVLPVSAESAGLIPKQKGSPHGSDILLEAIIEAEVAHNAKEFFSQPQNQIPHE